MFFIYGGLLSSFPLYSGGGVYEFGLATRAISLFEHRLYYSNIFPEEISLGYGGDIRVGEKVGLIFGIKLGGIEDHDIISFTLGLKTIY